MKKGSIKKIKNVEKAIEIKTKKEAKKLIPKGVKNHGEGKGSIDKIDAE